MKIHIDISFETMWGKQQWERLFAVWQDCDAELDLVSAAEADVHMISFADPDGEYVQIISDIATSDAFRKITNLMVFDPQDNPMGLFPGLYCSLRRPLFDRNWHRTGAYPFTLNDRVTEQAVDGNCPPPLLFSFQGNDTSRIRRHIYAQDFGRDDILIEKQPGFWSNFDKDETAAHRQRYADTISESRFVLCPRGIGTGSFRLFETMKSARVPIILSDSWATCDNIDWEKFSLRVPERSLNRISELCEQHLVDWPILAKEARGTWEKWFSNEGMAKLIHSAAESILAGRPNGLSSIRNQWTLRRAWSGARTSLAKIYGRVRG